MICSIYNLAEKSYIFSNPPLVTKGRDSSIGGNPSHCLCVSFLIISIRGCGRVLDPVHYKSRTSFCIFFWSTILGIFHNRHSIIDTCTPRPNDSLRKSGTYFDICPDQPFCISFFCCSSSSSCYCNILCLIQDWELWHSLDSRAKKVLWRHLLTKRSVFHSPTGFHSRCLKCDELERKEAQSLRFSFGLRSSPLEHFIAWPLYCMRAINRCTDSSVIFHPLDLIIFAPCVMNLTTLQHKGWKVDWNWPGHESYSITWKTILLNEGRKKQM